MKFGAVAGVMALVSAGVVAPAPPAPFSAQKAWEEARQETPIVEAYKGLPVTVTAYNAVAWQTDSTPWLASCGRLDAAPGPVLAVSRDLFYKGGRKRCGETIVVTLRDRVIVGVVWDTMAARYKSRVDVLMGTVGEARKFGVQKGHLLWGKTNAKD